MVVNKAVPVTSKIKQAYKPMKLVLPTQNSVPETDISRYSFFIYGKQGIGKTTLSLQFPNALHMMFEPGAKSKALRKIEPANWKEVEGYIKLIKDDTAYKTVVIDTCDLMWDMCTAQVCEDKGVDYLKDIGFGDGYSIAGTRFRKALIDIHMNKGLIILSHDKMRISEEKNEEGYIIPSVPKRGADTIAKWADLTAHYYINVANERLLKIRANAKAEAKCRPDEFFNYTDGTPIMNIPMGKSAGESYENFLKSFNNELENPKKQTKQKPKSFTITK